MKMPVQIFDRVTSEPVWHPVAFAMMILTILVFAGYWVWNAAFSHVEAQIEKDRQMHMLSGPELAAALSGVQFDVISIAPTQEDGILQMVVRYDAYYSAGLNPQALCSARGTQIMSCEWFPEPVKAP